MKMILLLALATFVFAGCSTTGHSAKCCTAGGTCTAVKAGCCNEGK